MNCAFNDLRHWQFVCLTTTETKNLYHWWVLLHFSFLLGFGWWRRPDPLDPQETSEHVQEAERHRGGKCHRHLSVSLAQKNESLQVQAILLWLTSLTLLQVIPAVKGGQALCSCYERERLGDQAEIWQPLLLQGVHTGWVRNRFMCKQVNTRESVSLCQTRFSGWREPLTSCLEESRRWCVVMARSVGNRFLFPHVICMKWWRLSCVSFPVGWQRLLCCAEGSGGCRIRHRGGSHLCPSGLVWMAKKLLFKQMWNLPHFFKGRL